MDVEIVDLPSLRVGVVHGDLAHAMETWQRFGAVVDAMDMTRHPGVSRAAILPAEVLRGEVRGRPERVRYDAALVMPEGVALPAGLVEDRVPAGRYARALYVGPYEGLAGAWSKFTQDWLPMSGQRIGNGVCFEVYLDHNTAMVSVETRTELHIPLA
jgi:AraC family transcriptional regulator